MTLEIAAVLLILLVSLVLFVTEKLRMDVVALLVMSALGVSRLVEPTEVIAGFSDPAVITVWSMFILSAGLSITGVADIIGRQVLKLAGRSEPRMILVIMLTTGVMSGIMNNIGVAALMLPVIMDIARRTNTSPSRLLMPMAYASLLGGLTTLVGTPPNLVASGALKDAGFEGFSLFEFAPVGVPALIIGSLFVAFIGRHMLPKHMPESIREQQGEADSKMRFFHDLDEHRFLLRVSDNSPLHDLPISESHLGDLLGLQVFSIERSGETITEIDSETTLKNGDLLNVQGRKETVREFIRWHALEMGHGPEILEILGKKKLVLLSATVAEGAEIAGLKVCESDFSRRFGGYILSIRRGSKILRRDFADFVFQAGDQLQIESRAENSESIKNSSELVDFKLITEESIDQIYPADTTLIGMDVPDDSRVIGMKISETGFSKLDLRILGIARKSGSLLIPSSSEIILTGDKLLIHGNRKTVLALRRIEGLEVISAPENGNSSEPTDLGYSEVTLAPQSDLVGKTLRELNFRNRYGLNILSIWRNGKSIASHLRNMSLEFGDALLLSGPREKIEALAHDDDFLVLSRSAYDDPDNNKSPLKSIIAAVLMLSVVGIVLAGVMPIQIAAIAGATLMIVCRCLNIDQAYRAIEWKSVFLIACMIPLGVAMKETGAAKWLGDGVAAVAGPFGPWGLIIALYLMTSLATTIVPTSALVLIMANIGMDAAATMDIDPRMIVMAIAMAASASFTSPISHPANVLVMGPGGYRFVDYVKMGLILALVVALTVLPLLAWWWGRQ
ncbi:SLC13 family permease [bacterium]|nr:SLC13 family permease [bacterium]